MATITGFTSGSDTPTGATTGDDTASNSTAGNDSINGLAGSDLASYLALGGAITVSFSAFGNGTVVKAPGGTDTLVSMERIQGTNFNDSIGGSSGNDSYIGSDGNDTYNGGAQGTNGNPLSSVGGQGDFLSYWNWGQQNVGNGISYSMTTSGSGTLAKYQNGVLQSTDTITSVELVQGTAHNDVFTGTTASDSFLGSLGNDAYFGGSGFAFDFLGYSIPGGMGSGPTSIRVDMSLGIVDKMSSGNFGAGGTGTPNGGTDGIAGVNSIFGTSGNDYFIAGDPNHSVYGNNNTSETFGGGFGNDTFVGTNDGQYGGEVFLNANYSYVQHGIAVNLSTGTANIDVGDVDTFDHVTGIFGTNFNDTLTGGGYYRTPWGTPFDLFLPQGGNDTVIGSDLTYDRVQYNNATAAMTVDLTGWNTGGDGLVNNAFVGGEVDHLQGSIEQIYTGSGNDTILGSTRDESFVASFGSNSVVGGGGEDTIQYSNFIYVHGVTVHLGGVGNQNGTATHDNDTLGSSTQTDTLVGISAAVGTHFADQMYAAGVAVKQEFEGLQGNDSLYGDSANGAFTFASYLRAQDAVVVNLGTGTASDGFGFTDTLVDIQGVKGSMWDDSITGSAANEGFVGNAGADTIDGGAGNDTISYQEDRGDSESSFHAISGVVVVLADSTLPGLGIDAWGFPDTLINIENVFGSRMNDIVQGNKVANDIEGKDGNDVLSGLAGVDTLLGGDGNDTMDGGGGGDSMVGGLGDDLYVVDVAGDKVKESAGEGDDSVALRLATGTYTLPANVEDVYMIGASTANVVGNTAANWMRGSTGANSLSGGTQNDTLNGASGNDILNGGAGKDLLIGGQGADHFVFGGTGITNVAGNTDIVRDFTFGTDDIDLSATTYSGIGALGALGPSDVRFYSANGAKTAHDADDRIIYDSATGKLYYDADGTGSGSSAVLVATFQGHPTVSTIDINVVT